MDQVVTLNWLNCLCDSSRRNKLRKLTDTALLDHLLELLIKFQFCTKDCAKYNQEEKKKLIVKFLSTKVKDYNYSRLFIDEQNILVACWVFLYHIVWSLEDATLRNQFSFHLDNSSQEFIKSFLECVQEQEITENVISECLRHAKQKCAHLELERSPRDWSARTSANSTPNNQTPTGIKRKMSSTLREFLLSPNSQKKFVEEHTKELKRLKTELNLEICEKVEVMDENDRLKHKLDQLNKQLEIKVAENLRLRREMEIMECSLSEATSAAMKSCSDERELSDLRIRLEELQSYVTNLETENVSISNELSDKEKNIISITEECNSLKKQFDELQLILVNKEEVLQRISKDKEFFKTEMNNLKEFNQDLSEKIAVLESTRSNPTIESNAPNLESELQFQLMKDTIDWAKKNMAVIETEQTRLINENRSLNERVKNLLDDKKEIDSTLKELNSRIDTLKTENITLKSTKENLTKKLKQTEAKLLNTNRDYESYRTRNESSIQKLTDEKEHLQSEMYDLKRSLEQYAHIVDDLHNREEYLIMENKDVEAELEKTKEHLSRNETLLQDFNAQMEHLKSENLKLSMKLNDLESQHKNTNAKLTEVSKEKNKLLKNREETEKKLAKNKETIESLVKQTSQEQDRCKELTKVVEVHMKKIEHSENLLKKLEEDRLDLNKRINIQNEELKLTESRYRYEAEAHDKAKTKLAELEQINVDQQSTNERLENDLKSKQLENKTLVCKIKELEEYLQKTEHGNKKLKNSLDELTKEKDKITLKCYDLEQKSSLDHNIIQSLTDQLTQVQNQRTDLEGKIQSLTEQLDSGREIIRDLQNDNTKLKNQLNDFSLELKNIHVLYHNENKINETLHLEINDLRRIIAEHRDEIEKVEKQRDIMSSANQTLEKTLCNAERELKSNKEQLVKYKEDAEFMRNEQIILRDELSTLEASLKCTKAENEDLKDLAEKMKCEKLILKESLSQLQEESSTLKASLEKVNSNKQIVCDKLDDLTHQHENILNERVNLIESIESFKSQVPSLTGEIDDLRAEINQLTGSNETLKNQLIELTSQMQSVEAEKFATKAQYDSLVQQLQNLENTYTDVIKNKQQLEKSNVERQNMIESLQNDLKSTSALNSQLNEKLLCLENEISQLRDKLDNYKEKSKSLQQTIDQLETTNQQLTANCDVLVKQKNLQCDQYESKIAALNDDVLGMRDQLEKINQINETQLKSLESTKTTLQQTQTEKENLQKYNSALIEQNQRIDLDLKNETNHVDRLENKVAEFERLFGDQTTEIKLLKNDYTRSNDENQRLNDQLKDLQNNICEVRERLKASVQEAETLESEKKSLLKKIVDFEHSFDKLQQENQILLKNVQDVKAEKQLIVVEKENLMKHTKDNEVIINKLNSEIVELQSCINKLSGENKCYEEKLKSAETTLISAKEEKREFEEKCETIYQELIVIQAQYETAKENNSKLKFKIAQLEETNDNQKKQIEKLEQNLTNEALKLSNIEEKLSSVIEQRDTETSAMKSENERLYEENKNYLNAVKRLEELQSERESLLCSLEQKECKISEITSRWQVELNTMRDERSRDAAKITELLEDCKMKQETVSALEKELSELQKCYEELNEDKTRAMNELREMFLRQIDQLLSSNETLKNENTKLHETNKEKVWYLNEMRKRINPIMDALEEHEKKLLWLKEQNDALTKEIDECNNNKWTLKSQNEQLAVLVAQTDKEKERLNKEIQNLKDEKEILRFKTDELKLDNEEMKNDNNRLRKFMRKESSEHEELKKQTEILSENVEKTRQDTEKLALENNQLKQYIEQLKRDQDQQIEAKNTEVDKVTASIKELQNELETLQNKHTDLSKRSEKLLEERNAMLDQKIIFEQDNIKLKRRLEEITVQKNEVYTMNELNSKAFENRIQSLKSQNDDQLVTIQNLRGENEVLRSEMEAVKVNATLSTRKQVEKLEKKIGDLTKTNSQLNERDDMLKKEVKLLSEANNRLQTEMEQQISSNKSLEFKLSNYEKLVSEKDALTKRVDELKVKLDESLEQNERITDEMNLIMDKNIALVQENENLLAKMDELETKVENLNDTIITKDKEVCLLQDEYRIFKDEYRKLSEHKSELDKDWKENLINNFKSATTKCDELKERNSKLTEEIAENQSTIAALESEIEKIKANNVKLDETHVIASGSNNKTNVILKEENKKLSEEIQNLKKKMFSMKAFLDKEKENLRQKSEKLYATLTTRIEAEYAAKLERAKSEYTKLLHQKCSTKELDWKKKEEDYQRMLRKEKDHIKELSSQLWNMSDKYLSLRQNVESGLSSNDFRRYSMDNFFSPGTLSRRTQSATHLNMMDGKFQKPLDFDRRLSTMSEDIQFHSKNKKPLALTSGKKFSLSSAKVFPTEDEEMEIFDNACLADLKQGRMADDSDFNKQRLSVLQARNSLCPPHLKSSYPAETQFLPLPEFKENDIKMGLSSCDNEHSDIENLLPGDRTKKNRNQTSYKKPGPPTPSKNGGRASTIGVETPRNILKESNDNGTARRKSFTPRLFNFFPIRGHATVTAATSQHNQDENPSVTPKRNRLQSLRRRFSKNPQELGNTNSGFS